MNSDSNDNDEDEWGTHELILDEKSKPLMVADLDSSSKGEDQDEDEYWNSNILNNTTEKSHTTTTVSKSKNEDINNEDDEGGELMFLIDVTMIDSTIHSKYDRNSVNNPEAASKLRKHVERNFTQYQNDSNLIASRAVIPCGTSVWKEALARMRDDKKGHYFLPIFPPKQNPR